MKALAIDCAVSKIIIAAKNDEHSVHCVYDIGMKQSETIVPAIEYVLTKAGLTLQELDYLTITAGPGSFTGLRLGFAAIKAIEMTCDIPVYGISSLEAYDYAYTDLNLPVLSLIDANKDKFYARISDSNSIILEDGDYDIDFILEKVSAFEKIIIAGPDSLKFKQIMINSESKTTVLVLKNQTLPTEALFAISESKIEKKEPSMKDFDGPVYLRASEAELNLKK